MTASLQPIDIIIFGCGMLAGAGALVGGFAAWWAWSERDL